MRTMTPCVALWQVVVLGALMGVGRSDEVVSDVCYEAVDVAQVQDMTSSFDDLWGTMAEQVPRVLDHIYAINPNSRFAFMTFGDKPVKGEGKDGVFTQLGYGSDYCVKVDRPLGQPTGEEMQKLFAEYSSKARGGGGDWPENVLGGLMRSVMTRSVGWRDVESGGEKTSAEGISEDTSVTNHTRVVVVVTDATSHLAPEVETLTGHKLREFDISEDMIENSGDPNVDCDAVEYPTVKRVAEVLKEHNTVVIVLAAPGGTFRPDGTFVPYKSLALKGKKYRVPEGLAMWYEDILKAEGVNAFATMLDSKMEVYFEAFKDAMDKFQSWRCAVTTTETPTTTTTTTTRSPTWVPPETTSTTTTTTTRSPTWVPPETTSTTVPTTTRTPTWVPDETTSTTVTTTTRSPTWVPPTTTTTFPTEVYSFLHHPETTAETTMPIASTTSAEATDDIDTQLPGGGLLTPLESTVPTTLAGDGEVSSVESPTDEPAAFTSTITVLPSDLPLETEDAVISTIGGAVTSAEVESTELETTVQRESTGTDEQECECEKPCPSEEGEKCCCRGQVEVLVNVHLKGSGECGDVNVSATGSNVNLQESI